MFDATPIRPSWGRSVEAVRLALLAERARPIAASRTQLLPVLASLQDLLPEGGLRRATTIGIAADNAGGATTLALALIAGASGAGRWCVVKRIVDGQPWISMEDLVRTAGASRAQLESLATSGALRFLPEHANVNGRRALMWTAGAEAPELPEPSAFEDVADDLWSLGMTPDGTAVELIRPELKERGVVPAADLSVLSSERRVSVAGVVTHRQQPESARGAVFLNLEDETG
ncbi:MAG TPA: hypothetical protein VKR22_08285, partial [Acidimicrobiales bacterium]|nr:hypothetical protein [Acidimicrobiales bacterium]